MRHNAGQETKVPAPFLRDVLDSHFNSIQEGALEKNLGDGFLLKKNGLYRAIRQEAQRIGIGYTLDDFCDYHAYPMLALPEILVQKKVPYFDNVTSLVRLELKNPGAFRMGEIPMRKANYVFHESCHLIAENRMSPLIGTFGAKPEQNRAFVLLLGESFANACEALGNMFIESDMQSYLYAHNSYIHLAEETVDLQRFALKELGSERLFKFVFFSYVCSNFLLSEITADHLAPMLLICGSETNQSSEAKEKLLKLFNISTKLSLQFRTLTNSFFFKAYGLGTDHEELLQFSFLKIFAKNESAIRVVDGLARLFSEIFLSGAAQVQDSNFLGADQIARE
jgi:hypothetical protein